MLATQIAGGGRGGCSSPPSGQAGQSCPFVPALHGGGGAGAGRGKARQGCSVTGLGACGSPVVGAGPASLLIVNGLRRTWRSVPVGSGWAVPPGRPAFSGLPMARAALPPVTRLPLGTPPALTDYRQLLAEAHGGPGRPPAVSPPARLGRKLLARQPRPGSMERSPAGEPGSIVPFSTVSRQAGGGSWCGLASGLLATKGELRRREGECSLWLIQPKSSIWVSFTLMLELNR